MDHKAFISLKDAFTRGGISLIIGFLFPSTFIGLECPLWSKEFFIVGFSSAFMSYLIWEGNVWITNYFYDKFTWEDKAFKRLGYHVIAVLIYTIVVVIVCTNLMHLIMDVDPPTMQQWAFILIISCLISVLILTIHERIFYFRSWVKSQKEAQQLKANYAEAQYNALKSRVNPHFLFNSLNTLASIIHESPDKATDFVTKLSGVYRYVLKANEKDLATIKEEIEVAKTFVFLLKTRFEDDLNIDFEIKEDLEGFIPPLSLQLLIENAVKHNVVSPDSNLNVKVFNKGGKIHVSNSLKEKEVDLNNSSKTGLNQIKQRYEIYKTEGFKFYRTDSEFIVELPIIQS